MRAPFAGVITVRNVDNGALIGAGSGTNNQPFFRMAQTDSLRIFVNVPQTYVAIDRARACRPRWRCANSRKNIFSRRSPILRALSIR